MKYTVAVLAALALLGACSEQTSTPSFDIGDPSPDAAGNTPPSPTTARSQSASASELPLDSPTDFDDAQRGLIASHPNLVVKSETGETIWDMPAYAFLEGEAPPASINPSLWRQARLNNIHGLFEVVPGIHQLRGHDLANMTLIDGESGWIVVDPLTAKETAAAAIAFAREHLGNKPVSAIVFTHSHVDHFGGVLGVLSAEEARERNVPIIAPEGFIEEATSENIIAGVTMGRRSQFMYGARLPRNERGHVGSGLGKEPAYGRFGILPPTFVVSETPTEHTIDGLKFVFQYAPGSEAPAELTFYLPDLGVFCGAEVVSHNMHNLYTLRGAKVRDALRWSGYIDEILRMFGEAKVYFGSHHWPIWGNDRVRDFLEKQRDMYKFIHDQTLRGALLGYTPREIAERIELPAELQTSFPNRGYYGTLKHNAKAVYQRYFGWFDGNPANLDPLPPVEAGKKYVELAGGPSALLDNAKAAYERGEYRWTAEVLNHLVFAEPENDEAKALLADTYDQLGYQAESGPWRDVYLTGAFELRHGGPSVGVDLSGALDMLQHAPIARFLDAMAARLDPKKAAGKEMRVNLVFTDTGDSHVLEVSSSVLRHYARELDPDAGVTLKITKTLFLRMLTGNAGLKETLFGDELSVEGSRLDLVSFFRLFDETKGTFNIVEP
jgi:alkyl sulfatase BDS1-like metallo-beta-lactamase superfamily hydrolase